MLEPIRRHLWCRVLAALSLAACADSAVARAGYVEVVGALGRGVACDGAGDLRLEGLDAPALVLVSGGELCAGVPLRRELPPGLYALSWQNAQEVAPDHREPSLLRGPAVVSLFPGQLTRLRVQVEASPAPGVSAATGPSNLGEGRPEPSLTCGQEPRRSGAS
ncbi:MAG: hypothetical protein ABI895_09665 [Deltaproteobacteria bacterium]